MQLTEGLRHSTAEFSVPLRIRPLAIQLHSQIKTQCFSNAVWLRTMSVDGMQLKLAPPGPVTCRRRLVVGSA